MSSLVACSIVNVASAHVAASGCVTSSPADALWVGRASSGTLGSWSGAADIVGGAHVSLQQVADGLFEIGYALFQVHRVAGDDGFEGVAAASADDVAAVFLDKARGAIRAFKLELLRGAREKSDGNDAGFHGCFLARVIVSYSG
jgi:hypothetical protein